MQWEIRQRDNDRRHKNLTTDAVRNLLADGSLSPEDWTRPMGQPSWRQIATVDEFEGAVATVVRRRRLPVAEPEGLDMTPMIDVTFLLLIFFMITATFHLQKGLDFPPDKTQDTAKSDAPLPGLADFGDRIVVEINESDSMFVKESATADAAQGAPVPADQLVDALQRAGQQQNKNKVLIVTHEMSSHEAVVAAIDAAARARMSDVALADVTTQSLPSGGATIIRRN